MVETVETFIAPVGEFQQLTLDYAIAPPFKPIGDFDPDNRGEATFMGCPKASGPWARYIAPVYLKTETLP